MAKERLSYEELDVIIKNYKTGDKDASDRLYSAFEGFIVKYIDIIHRGQYHLEDKGVRDFLSLYMRDERRRYVHSYFKMPSVRQEMYEVSDNLREMFSQFSEDEIKHELVCALFTLARRYVHRDGEPRFHTYVQRVFHYQVQRQLAELIVDPVAYRFDHNSVFKEEEGIGAESLEEGLDIVMLMAGQSPILIEDDFDEIGDNWINGYTANDPFTLLSKLERRIMKMYYVDDLTDQQIADTIGSCRATVNRRRLAAKEKIKNVRESNQV